MKEMYRTHLGVLLRAMGYYLGHIEASSVKEDKGAQRDMQALRAMIKLAQAEYRKLEE